VQDVGRTVDVRGEGDCRLAIHQVSDEIQGWTGEGKGIAATRIMIKIQRDLDNRIWRIDADGQNLVPVTRSGPLYLTPAWSPDGERVAYSEWSDGTWVVWLQTLRTGTRNRVQSKGNTFPAFSPDGKTLAFVNDGEKGANIHTVDISGTICCEGVLNQTRFADNNRPAYSPDGSRLAFVTNRAGSRQIWVMDRDGTLPSVLVIPETGGSNAGAPAWSPDGSQIAYAEDVQGGGRQVYVYNIGTGSRRLVTGNGRNDFPSWAPDSRHLVVKTSSAGREQLRIFDIVTGTSRSLTTPGAAAYPAWSPALGATNTRSGGPP
jgi:TolB protein